MRRISKLLKSCTSLILVFAMVMGMGVTAIAAEIDEPISYVSLGDSMANGYGLDGYEEDNGTNYNGYLRYVAESYPALFADWLTRTSGRDVEHVPMAISAMRAEDLHFILEFPYGDSKALKVAEGEWDEEKWNATFATGDYYTWKEFTTYRFHDYAKKDTAKVAKEMQSAVANADLISLGVGNADFGVFMLGRILEVMSLLEHTPDEAEWIDLERALAECNEDVRTIALQVYGEIRAIIAEKATDDIAADALTDVITYTVVSYMMNYAGVIDRIVELNPDAEIILVGMVNTMSGMELRIPGVRTVDMGRVMGAVTRALNAYLAALPAAYQKLGAYKDATFYLAEATEVELLYTELDTTVNDTVRRRTIKELNDLIFNAETGMLGGFSITKTIEGVIEGQEMELTIKIGVEEITLEDVEAFEKGIALSAGKNFTVALYLAFEEAIAAASNLSVLDISTFASLTEDLNGILNDLTGTIDFEIDDAAKTAVVAGVLKQYNAWLNTSEGKAAVAALYNEAMAEIESAARESYIEALNEAIENMNTNANLIPSIETAYEPLTELKDWDAVWAVLTANRFDAAAAEVCFSSELSEMKDELGEDLWYEHVWTEEVLEKTFDAFDQVQETMGQLDDNAGMLPLTTGKVNAYLGAWAGSTATAYFAPELAASVNEVLVKDDAMMGLLHLLARMLIGDGIGVHPNANGHEAIAEAMVTAYDEKYTVDQAVIDRAQIALNAASKVIMLGYEKAFAAGYKYAVENGYVQDAVETIEAAEADLLAFQTAIDQYKTVLAADAYAGILEEMAEAQAGIAALKALLVETEVMNQATMEDAMALVAALEANLDAIVKHLENPNNMIPPAALPVLQNKIETMKQQLKEELTAKVETAITEAINYAADYLHDKLGSIYDEFILAITDVLAAIDVNLPGLVDQFDDVVWDAMDRQFPAIIETIYRHGENSLVIIIDLLKEDLRATIEEAIERATHGEYTVDENSYYVAIGDTSAAAQNSYANLLAAELGLNKSFNNLGTNNQTVEESIAAILGNAVTVAGADLITIGYSNNTFFEFMIAQIKNSAGFGEVVEMDWDAYIGENGANYIQQALDMIRGELTNMGVDEITIMGMNAAEMLMLGIESYAYAYANYAVKYPAMIQTIREINPDALILSVGMSNTMADIELDVSKYTGKETVIDLGAYIQYLVNIANAEALAHAMIVEGIVYVDAPEVEIAASADKYDDVDVFLRTAMFGSFADLYATDNGHAYIMDQILNALEITVTLPAYTVGDVNEDGKINVYDAIDLLTIIANNNFDELSAAKIGACDVNGNGTINVYDAIDLLTMIANQ